MQAGKGAGYARWAKVFNLKQMAQTMNYLSEHNLLEYAVLEEKTAAVTAHHNELSAQIKAAEKRMAEIAVLRTHIINYAKTREVYVAYRKAGYNKALSTLGGDIYIGAMTVINSVREVMTMPANGITGGAQPVLGYNYGAKEFGRVKKGILFTTGICVTYTLVAWGVVFLFPHELIRIFNDNPQLVDVGARMLHIYFFGFCFMALQFSGQSTFTALGRAKYAIFFSIFRKLVVVVPLIFILPNFLGVEGVFWSEPISNLIGGSACFITMMLTLWRKL